MPASYHQIHTLVAGETGLRLGTREAPLALAALERLELGARPPDPSTDRLLLLTSQREDDPHTLLCLRCRLSQPVREYLVALHRRISEEHALDLIEMAAIVLDDAGGLELRQGLPFRWSALAALPGPTLHPFSADLLCSWDPALSSLGNWSREKTQSHPELKAYLRQRQVMLISPWALLHDSSPTRVRQSWALHGRGALSSEQAAALHQAYQAHYRPARVAHRSATGRQSGWSPDGAFLRAIAPDQPPSNTRDSLEAIARAIRLLLVGDPLAEGYPQEQEEVLADPASLVDPAEEGPSPAELMAAIHAALERAAEPAVRAALNADQPLWRSSPERHRAWLLYGEGQGQRAIAEACGHKQAWVSKLLNEKALSSTIATAAALELRRQSAFADPFRTLEGAERLVEALRNHLITPEQGEGSAPLRLFIARLLPPLAP